MQFRDVILVYLFIKLKTLGNVYQHFFFFQRCNARLCSQLLHLKSYLEFYFSYTIKGQLAGSIMFKFSFFYFGIRMKSVNYM